VQRNSEECACTRAPKLIFPCSGAADVGEIADRAARSITKEGAGNMHCLAGIGGRVSAIVASTGAASKILVIDGCPSGCAKRTLEAAGFNSFEHLRVTDLGMEKGNSPATKACIASVATRGAEKLNS
jgi:uncharacterized metal-binding protein